MLARSSLRAARSAQSVGSRAITVRSSTLPLPPHGGNGLADGIECSSGVVWEEI